MNYSLPTTVEANGNSYKIRNKGDFRVVLDAIAALNDPNLTDEQKSYCACFIFFEDFKAIKMNDISEAVGEMFTFISGGKTKDDIDSPKVMDWEQDFDMIVGPVNRIIGKEIRAMDYLHWWSFLSAYYEIGDCAFAQIVSIRNKLARGRNLEKWEKEFYREHKKMIDFQTILSDEEQAELDELKRELGVI